MAEEMVTMVRGKANSLKSLLLERGFLWSAAKGYWTRCPAYDTADRVALEQAMREAGGPAEIEVRNIRKAWA
jgi:hypothetical protein